MSNGLSDKSVIHVSAWARMFTQFRMPLIRRQRESFGRVLLYCPPGEAEHVARLKDEGFEVVAGAVSPRPGPAMLAEVMALSAYLKKERFDVLVAHQPMGALVGIPAGRLAGVPVKIYSTGGLKYSPDKKGVANLLMKYGEMGIIRLSDGVFLVNREDEAILKTTPSARDKAFYVGPRGGCGVDTNAFNPENRLKARAAARREFGLDDGTFVIGYVGRLVWEKGFKEMAAAAEMIKARAPGKRSVFLVMGDGPEAPEIKEYVRQKGVSEHFMFGGYRFDPETFMSAFDAFVLPSYREGLPVSLLEAMSLGLPCIATDIRGSRDLLAHGETGLLVPARDASGLAEAILSVMDGGDNSKLLGLKAAQFIKGNYDEEVLVDRLMRIIEGLTDAGRRAVLP